MRFNYDDNYHNNIFTGIPVEGYTNLIEKILNHPSIHVHLNKKFYALSEILVNMIIYFIQARLMDFLIMNLGGLAIEQLRLNLLFMKAITRVPLK